MGRTTYTNMSRPAFLADWHSATRDGGHQIDWANVGSKYQDGSVAVVVGAAGAALNATSVPVAALSGPIPAGVTIDFGGAKFARLTAAAVQGAVTLTVAAIPTALVSTDTGYYWTPGSRKILRAGTAMGELLGAGKISPRVVTTNPATCLLATDAREDDPTAALSGYGVIKGGIVYENLLPDATGGPPAALAAAVKTELQTAGVGTGFGFVVYADTTT